jgi:hypothetical protein
MADRPDHAVKPHGAWVPLTDYPGHDAIEQTWRNAGSGLRRFVPSPTPTSGGSQTVESGTHIPTGVKTAKEGGLDKMVGDLNYLAF